MVRVSDILVISIFTIATAAESNVSYSTLPTTQETIADVAATPGMVYSENFTPIQGNMIDPRKTRNGPHFYVITRKYPDLGRRLLVGDAMSLHASGFNPSYPTRILIHGWMGTRTSIINRRVSAAYLERGEYNIIVVDWSQYANTFNYAAAKKSVGKVAVKIVDLLGFLSLYGRTSPESVYLIGHSLGAHLAGSVGRKLRPRKIGVIIALDAALPLYLTKVNERVAPSDAEYVLSIHTNGGQIGIHDPLGNASFYPNWGKKQLGCGADMFGDCSHRRAVEYFAESLTGVKSKFASHHCDSFLNILSKNCPAKDEVAFMGGDPIDKSYVGIFYVPINSK